MTFDGRDARVQSGVGSDAGSFFGSQVTGNGADGVLQGGVGSRAGVGLGQVGSRAGVLLGNQTSFQLGQRVERLGHSTTDLGLGGFDVRGHQSGQRVVDVRVVVQRGSDLAQRVQQLRSDALQVGDRGVGVRLGVGDASGQLSSGAEGVNDDGARVVQAGELDLFLGRVDPEAASGRRDRISG